MSDVKLFRTGEDKFEELSGAAAQVERALQATFEAHLDALLGVRFIASEHYTGQVHAGRIDTLGLDENGCPIIIEYKRAVNENVINQGLFYLDWLMDHKRDFEWLVLRKFGQKAAEEVDWSSPRLICVAGDFTKYDEHSIRQINRSIELLRYRKFSADLLMIELLHPPRAGRPSSSNIGAAGYAAAGDKYVSSDISYRIANAPRDILDVYEAVAAYLSGLGDDVQMREQKKYVAFRRIKNFACVEIFPTAKNVVAYLKLDPKTMAIEKGFTRDVSMIGHYGTGDLEVTMETLDDVARAQPLLARAYECG